MGSVTCTLRRLGRLTLPLPLALALALTLTLTLTRVTLGFCLSASGGVGISSHISNLPG